MLRTFADAFQGCYKDGTVGTQDCRWFSGVHLLVRFGIVIAFEMVRHHATYQRVGRLYVGMAPTLP